jgi:hypothetical protein
MAGYMWNTTKSQERMLCIQNRVTAVDVEVTRFQFKL